jgi:hypothetical protein
MKTAKINIIKNGTDDPNNCALFLGMVEVPADKSAKAMELAESLWDAFQASEPDSDSLYVEWLVKRQPRIFLREVFGHSVVFVG